MTLLRWHAKGKVSASEEIGMNGGKHWRWTARDIVKIKRYKKNIFAKVRDEERGRLEITSE